MVRDFVLEPWKQPIPVATVPLPPRSEPEPILEQQIVTEPDVLNAMSASLAAHTGLRSVARDIREGKLSLTGRMAALTERAQDFHKKTEGVLDEIEAKINKADTKLNVAAEKHHGYYDGIIAGVDESVAVVDRLSNGPLPEDGGS